MVNGHYVCDILDYNIGTWCNCDDGTITRHRGYSMNIYDELLIDTKQKNTGKECIWMDQIVLCPRYILKMTFLHRAPTQLLQGSQYQNKMNILRRV